MLYGFYQNVTKLLVELRPTLIEPDIWDGNFRFPQEVDSVSCALYSLQCFITKFFTLNLSSYKSLIGFQRRPTFRTFRKMDFMLGDVMSRLFEPQGIVGNLPPRKTWGTEEHIYLQCFRLDTRRIRFNYFLSRYTLTILNLFNTRSEEYTKSFRT